MTASITRAPASRGSSVCPIKDEMLIPVLSVSTCIQAGGLKRHPYQVLVMATAPFASPRGRETEMRPPSPWLLLALSPSNRRRTETLASRCRCAAGKPSTRSLRASSKRWRDVNNVGVGGVACGRRQADSHTQHAELANRDAVGGLCPCPLIRDKSKMRRQQPKPMTTSSSVRNRVSPEQRLGTSRCSARHDVPSMGFRHPSTR